MDWTLIINTFLATLPLTITAIGGLIVVLRKVEKVHKAANGMKDALIAAALVEGEKIGKDKEIAHPTGERRDG